MIRRLALYAYCTVATLLLLAVAWFTAFEYLVLHYGWDLY